MVSLHKWNNQDWSTTPSTSYNGVTNEQWFEEIRRKAGHYNPTAYLEGAIVIILTEIT